MKRWSLTLLVLCACGAASAEHPAVVVEVVPTKTGVPIAVTAKPPEPPRSSFTDIEGTRWDGYDSDGDHMMMEFRAGGKLHYRSPSGTYDNGTWEQHGQTITWETNVHYADYEAKLHDDVLEGSAHNKADHDWTFEYKRTDERFDGPGPVEDIPPPDSP